MTDRFVSGQGVWTDGTLFTNPVDGQVLCDTGELPRGRYLFGIEASASVDWVYDRQQRNAANDANTKSQRRRPRAGNEDFLCPNEITLDEGERLRVVLSGTIAGVVQVSIWRLSMRPR